MFFIKNLNCNIGSKKILLNVNLQIKPNETHVIMGPNGSGKSTLLKVLAGHPLYSLNYDGALFKGKNPFLLTANERALEGIFLGFQYPTEISGITNFDFMHLAYNEKLKYEGKKEVTPIHFFQIIEPFLKDLKMHNDFMRRNINEGFSGGEKKKSEILQMLVLSPDLIFFD